MDFSPEWRLLLACARAKPTAEDLRLIREDLARPDLDWDYVAKTSCTHGIAPLIYHSLHRSGVTSLLPPAGPLLYSSLKSTSPEVVPRTVLVQLQYHFYANASPNLFLTEQLLNLLNLLNEHGISALPFKGPVLTASVYGNLALRQCSDLDILIHKRDIPRVKDLLTSEGYRPGIQSHWEYHFMRNDTGVMVDLHWAIMPRYFPFALDIERLWDRLESVSLSGRMVPNLSPQDLLLILCVHGSKHLWERLGWICDIAELIRFHQGVDWSRTMEEAGRLGVERMVALGLFLANDFLGTALSDDLLRRVHADRIVKSLATRIREQFFFETNSRFGAVKKSFFYLNVRERWRDKVQYSYRLLRPVWPVLTHKLSPVKHLLGF